MSHDPSDIQQLFKLASQVAKFIDDNEKFPIMLFNQKLVKAQSSYPEDYTIGMIARVVDKMASADKLLISRSEVKDLYHKFYSNNNKFASVFADEMGETPINAQQPVKPVEPWSDESLQDARDSIVDPVLANALDLAFGGTGRRTYNPDLGKRVLAACNSQFQYFGLQTKSSIDCNKDNVFVCSVGFETPRGTTSVLVPVETDGVNVHTPNVFIGNQGSQEITKANVVAYIQGHAGQTLKTYAGEVLDAALMARGSNNEISDVDLAVSKFKMSENHEMAAPSIMGIKVEQSNPNLIVNIPQLEDEQFMAMARNFDSAIGLASFELGSKTVKHAGELIARTLDECGFANHSIALHSSDREGAIYSVALNGGTTAFKVPMKITNGNVLPPSVLICEGSIKSFDRDSITEIIRSNGFDRSAAISSSPLYGLKPSELVNIVKSAIAEGNYVKAEDSLNILSESDDAKAYGIALNAFTNGLSSRIPDPVKQVKCSAVVRTRHSQYDICSHTGLPLHQIANDKHGNCIRKHRQAMDESNDGSFDLSAEKLLGQG